MWVFLNNAMLSVVENRGDPSRLMVRGRLKGDIERVFPGAKVSRTPNADYLYRAVVDREDVAQALASAARGIDYDNFKNSVSAADSLRGGAYARVWLDMAEAQDTVFESLPTRELGNYSSKIAYVRSWGNNGRD